MLFVYICYWIGEYQLDVSTCICVFEIQRLENATLRLNLTQGSPTEWVLTAGLQ